MRNLPALATAAKITATRITAATITAAIHFRIVLAVFVGFAVAACNAGYAQQQNDTPPRPGANAVEDPFPKAVTVPEGIFDGGAGWLNTAEALSMKDLKGKIVLVDFWTYCCINCHHVLPDLERLEKKYPNELVVIGVHSAKFEAEKDTNNIRRKVAEYRIKHPVINDA